ncbi:ApeA N-terminal domain 1-containing protein [Shewanella baltica]|uniref:ApeA N-terminal domain 1-containing protein n=1 Tax=Shewanella baltica TaxID=62322 RepID=UPI00217EB383|nr:HEPN domain-containing protein [Shewanella baltica]MCS6241372.1 hypothetical protein [Shewanella baltica]
MITQKYSSFEQYEFIGEFFISECSCKTKFPGRVKYDLESGLTLSFNIAEKNFPMKTDILIGILDNGKKCTLVGPFDFSQSGVRMGNVYTRFGSHEFNFLIIGEFTIFNEQYKSAHFNFSNMQEFFYPQGWINNVEFDEGVIDKIECADWILEVRNKATVIDITHNFNNLIIASDKSVANKIITSVNEILAESENNSLLLRKTLEFYFLYESTNEINIHSMYESLYRISSLFSIFMNIPVFPDEVTLIKSDKSSVKILAGQKTEARTIELARSRPSHHLMPINRKSVNLNESLIKWFELYDNYKVLSTTFQYETNFRTLHTAYSDIILYLANIEAIAIDIGTHKKYKYISPINKYASRELTKSLETIFKRVNTNDLGTNLSDIRGELAHEGRPKKLMYELDIVDYIDIASLLKLIVVSHLLSKLGFNIRDIHAYQVKLIQ